MKLIKTSEVLEKLGVSKKTFEKKILNQDGFPAPVTLYGECKAGANARFVEEEINDFIESRREVANDTATV